MPASVSNADADVDDGGMARIEAFSDGVFAIAITLLILEIRLPHDAAAGAAESAGLGPIIYAVATALAFVSPGLSLSVHGLLAVLYVIPHKARP